MVRVVWVILVVWLIEGTGIKRMWDGTFLTEQDGRRKVWLQVQTVLL